MTLQVGVRVKHKSFGEGVIAHGPIWAVGSDDLSGAIWSGPEPDMGIWDSEALLFVVEWDAAPSVPHLLRYGYEDLAQLATSRAWLVDGSVLEEVN